MNTVDLILLIFLGIGAVRGFRRGFILEIASVLALILGIAGGFHLLHLGMTFLASRFEISDEFLPVLSFLLIFVAIILLVNLIGKLIKKALDLTALGGLDRLAGGILGFVKWAFALSVLIWILSVAGLDSWFEPSDDGFVYPLVASFAPGVIDLLSIMFPFVEDLFESLTEFFSTLGG